MKKYNVLLYCVIFGGLLSCQRNDQTVSDQLAEARVQPPSRYYTDFNDEVCKKQLQQAKKDVRNRKLIYEINSIGIIRQEDEIEELLAKHGIEYIDAGPNCTLEQECYQYYMDSIIRKKYGEDFFIKINKEADSLFLSRWKTKLYDSWDIDEEPGFINRRDPKRYIEEEINLPPNWDRKPMKYKRQFLTVCVYVSNKGALEKWGIEEDYSLKESNLQFLPLLEREINRVLKTMKKWSPGKLENKHVNSSMCLDIDFDKRE